MTSHEHYVREVLSRIPTSLPQRERIEADIREHLEDALAAGDTPESALSRMGSPDEVAEEFLAAIPLRYAGSWRRLAAFALDMGVIVLVGAILAIAAVALGNLVPRHPAGWDYVLGAVELLGASTCVLILLGLILLYFPIQEGRFGRTLGKRLLGLWVVRESGLRIGYREAFLRRLSYYFEILAVDALFIPFTERRQRAFDIVARTVVIRL